MASEWLNFLVLIMGLFYLENLELKKHNQAYFIELQQSMSTFKLLEDLFFNIKACIKSLDMAN